MLYNTFAFLYIESCRRIFTPPPPPPSPSPGKINREETRENSFGSIYKKKKYPSLFSFPSHPNFERFTFSPFENISYFVLRIIVSGKKFFIELFNLHFNRPANAMIELIRVNHERDSRTISCLSSLFE